MQKYYLHLLFYPFCALKISKITLEKRNSLQIGGHFGSNKGKFLRICSKIDRIWTEKAWFEDFSSSNNHSWSSSMEVRALWLLLPPVEYQIQVAPRWRKKRAPLQVASSDPFCDRATQWPPAPVELVPRFYAFDTRLSSLACQIACCGGRMAEPEPLLLLFFSSWNHRHKNK